LSASTSFGGKLIIPHFEKSLNQVSQPIYGIQGFPSLTSICFFCADGTSVSNIAFIFAG
jgi:hypothetical protein